MNTPVSDKDNSVNDDSSKNTYNDFHSNIYVYETSLIHAVNEKKLQKVEMIINHQSFNPNLSQINASIFASVKVGQFDIFKKLINYSNVNILSNSKLSLLKYAVIERRIEIIDYILSNDKFDRELNKVFIIFCNEIRSYYNSKVSIEILEKLFEYERKNGHQINMNTFLPGINTFFTSISSKTSNIEEVVKFLQF